jgi:hypothetical protein
MSFHIVHIHRVTVQCEFIHDFDGKKDSKMLSHIVYIRRVSFHCEFASDVEGHKCRMLSHIVYVHRDPLQWEGMSSSIFIVYMNNVSLQCDLFHAN